MSQLSQSLDECLSPMHWGVRYKSACVSLIQTDGGAGDAMAFGVDCEIDNDMDGREGTHGRLHGSDWSGPGCHFFSAIGPGS